MSGSRKIWGWPSRDSIIKAGESVPSLGPGTANEKPISMIAPAGTLIVCWIFTRATSDTLRSQKYDPDAGAAMPAPLDTTEAVYGGELTALPSVLIVQPGELAGLESAVVNVVEVAACWACRGG